MILRDLLLTAAIVMTSNIQAQQQQLFDAGWQFTRNGKTINVDLPHDWDIYTAPDPKTGATGTGGGWYPGGKGEYRKTFKTPKGELTKLHFEGVYQKAEVYVNGQKAGHNMPTAIRRSRLTLHLIYIIRDVTTRSLSRSTTPSSPTAAGIPAQASTAMCGFRRCQPCISRRTA